ncbi:MAG: twin-arginine translocation signal domain-containing protein, partial [Nitrososphaerota archaeon]|nr:twin-arginine translocation signal domain-containing protein [Nitrososphaerota archaeon]
MAWSGAALPPRGFDPVLKPENRVPVLLGRGRALTSGSRLDLTRRDFLKLCSFMGAGAVATVYAADIKRVFAQVAQQNGGKVHLIW